MRQPDARAALQPAARALADELAWSRCVQPVRDFVQRGARAADKAHTDTAWLHTAREYGAAASAVNQARGQVSALQNELAIRLEHLNHAEANRAALQQELDVRLQVLMETNAKLQERDAQLQERNAQLAEVLSRDSAVQTAEQLPVSPEPILTADTAQPPAAPAPETERADSPISNTWLQRLRRRWRR
jgi:septal ring factor EnvC (AmiA/AmiB activator)